MATEALTCGEIPFGLWTEVVDPQTGLTVPGQGVHRFYRFERPVRLAQLEIPPPGPGLPWAAGLRGGGPRHLAVFAWDDQAQPQVIFDGELPPPRPNESYAISLGDVVTGTVSAQCDERYPVEIGFGQHHPTTYTVPFRILDGLRWFGQPLEEPQYQPPYQPALQPGEIAPQPLEGQQVTVNPYEVRFSSPYLTVGFGLVRPQLTFLGWDALGQGLSGENVLHRRAPMAHGSGVLGNPPGGNGPYLCDVHYDATCFLWTGTVEVEGNRVRYGDLRILPDWTVQVEFEVGVREIIVHLQQHVERERTALDLAAWRLIWDGRRAAWLGTLASPLRGARRNGGVESPGAWNLSGQGTLNFCAEAGPETVTMQTDTTGHAGQLGFAQIQIGCTPQALGTVTLRPGDYETTLRLEVRALEPITRPGAAPLPEGLRRCWGSAFAFRPEGGGFSNNGFSINCQNVLYFQADLAPYTKCLADGPEVMELLRYTATLAVQGGPGYACQWEQAMDAAPSLGITVARLHQARPNEQWLAEKWPYLRRPFEHILSHMDDSGLYVSAYRPGNSGGRDWSSNAMDTICFGYQDAYANALAYRALRGGVAVARDAGDEELSDRCRQVAASLRENYVPVLLNPETGLIGGWRSADGQLHDHAFVFINGMAICYGLVEKELAREILTILERGRLEIGHDDFRYGLCTSLQPIPRDDYKALVLGSPRRDDGRDTFGMFINGSLMPTLAYFYLRALSTNGFSATADRISEQLLDSFAQGIFEGGLGSGTEYFTFDGTPCGYEGTFPHGYHVLLAVAQHLGYIETLEPEWWPA